MRKPSASARRRGRTPAAGKGLGKDGSRKDVAAKAAKASGRSNGPSPRRAPATGVAVRDAQGERRSTEKLVLSGKPAPVADAHKGTSRGKYVYCIIESSDVLRFGPIGIGAEMSAPGFDVQLVVPASVIEGIGRFVKEIQKQQGFL